MPARHLWPHNLRGVVDWVGDVEQEHEEITRSLLQNATPHLHLTSLHELMSPANSAHGDLPLASPPPHCLSQSVTTHQSVTFEVRSGNSQKQPRHDKGRAMCKLFLFARHWATESQLSRQQPTALTDNALTTRIRRPQSFEELILLLQLTFSRLAARLA